MHYSNMIDQQEELNMMAEDDRLAGLNVSQSGGPRSLRYGMYAQEVDADSPHHGSHYRPVFDEAGRQIGKAMVPNLDVVNAAMDIRDHNKPLSYADMGYPRGLDHFPRGGQS